MLDKRYKPTWTALKETTKEGFLAGMDYDEPLTARLCDRLILAAHIFFLGLTWQIRLRFFITYRR